MLSVLALGIIKLFRGLYLTKPIGYLLMILITEIIVMMALI